MMTEKQRNVMAEQHKLMNERIGRTTVFNHTIRALDIIDDISKVNINDDADQSLVVLFKEFEYSINNRGYDLWYNKMPLDAEQMIITPVEDGGGYLVTFVSSSDNPDDKFVVAQIPMGPGYYVQLTDISDGGDHEITIEKTPHWLLYETNMEFMDQFPILEMSEDIIFSEAMNSTPNDFYYHTEIYAYLPARIDKLHITDVYTPVSMRHEYHSARSNEIALKIKESDFINLSEGAIIAEKVIYDGRTKRQLYYVNDLGYNTVECSIVNNGERSDESDTSLMYSTIASHDIRIIPSYENIVCKSFNNPATVIFGPYTAHDMVIDGYTIEDVVNKISDAEDTLKNVDSYAINKLIARKKCGRRVDMKRNKVVKQVQCIADSMHKALDLIGRYCIITGDPCLRLYDDFNETLIEYYPNGILLTYYNKFSEILNILSAK